MERVWVYMSFVHSEDLADQEASWLAVGLRLFWDVHTHVPSGQSMSQGCKTGSADAGSQCYSMQHANCPHVQEAVRLMEALKADCQAMGAEAVGAWAAEGVGHTVLHCDVIGRYGRFPHRDALLGRPSTAQEEAGLADGSIPWFK